ncbi:hypothetical protein M438DRAFT_348056 [Aureobasidium pullulans EXF-150]|uniref:Uncharacterized protein n=1 Tax=Aureobasidium pullulans EXF-150 TaxID=1043002 RepID=A0A074X7R9_AURPU|nr:uncharacterized protein M438DRAFT_348056 [Aureobasidium pullulans EXF-150]KEQ81570.1 hypothetical protein M438DRAFT_348056 [Aureobasidium pullulans EXF-150]
MTASGSTLLAMRGMRLNVWAGAIYATGALGCGAINFTSTIANMATFHPSYTRKP